MDKKSFVRGFGIGVLFTAIILGISCMIRTSDAEVVRRARELGMVYGTEDESLFQETETASNGAVSAEEDEKESQETEKPAKQTEKPKTKKVDSKGQDDDVSDIENEISKMEEQAEESTRKITIDPGEGSDEVSVRLEALDLIDDADEFDSYLQKNGYSNKIRPGVFKIPSGATYEDIAKTITTKP